MIRQMPASLKSPPKKPLTILAAVLAAHLTGGLAAPAFGPEIDSLSN